MGNEITANVASCVMQVSDPGQSLNFYNTVFSCRVASREEDMALLRVHDPAVYSHTDIATGVTTVRSY